MAITFVDYTATASQTDFLFNFEYLEDEHVAVFVDGVKKTIGADQDYTVGTSPSKRIVLNAAATGGEIVRVRRISAPETDLVDFQNGSVLTESELDRAYLHNRYLAEESAEQNDVSMRLNAGATGFDALNKKIFNVVDPTTDQDAATKNYVDETVAGVALGTVPDGSITSAKLEDGAVTTNKLANTSVTTTKLTDGSVTAAKISTTDANFNVQSNGYVGIGTTNPGYELEVVGWLAVIANALSTDSVINLAASNSTNYSAKVRIKATSESEVNESSSLTFSTTDSSDVVAEKMRIDSNGNVGIGNINPTHALDVSGDVNVSLGNTFKINGANFLLDEDAMTSNSDTRGATQQSIKAYVDSQVLSKWDSGWVNQDDQPTPISVVSGATMVFNHDLGSAALGAVFSVYAAKDSSGTDMQQALFSFWEDTNGNDAAAGIQLTSITNSVVNVQVSANGMMAVNSSGTVTGVGYVPFGSGSYSHIRLVLIG
jgi:hypothetical protein